MKKGRQQDERVDLMKECVFLRLNIHKMGDKRGVSTDVLGDVDVDKNFVSIRKKLFKSHHFDAIRSCDNETRKFVRKHCLPFDPGIYMVPIAKAEQVNYELEICHVARTTLVDEFVAAWPEIIQLIAPTNLRSWYNRPDYRDAVGDQFWMSWSFYVFGSPTQLQDIAPAVFKAESEKLKDRMSEAFDTIRQVQGEAFLQLLTHLREVLESDASGLPKRIAASTVRNLQEFVRDFQISNVTHYGDLQRYVEQADTLLQNVDAPMLRNGDGLRQRVRTELSFIEEAITKTVVKAPVRMLRRG